MADCVMSMASAARVKLFKSAVRTKAWTASTSSARMAFYPFQVQIIEIVFNIISQ
jgi:hypothetical protein